ncbi:MAG: disulfide bond formation protein B [Minisyncoccia bacterium]
MLELVPAANYYSALGALLGQIVTIGLIVALVMRSRSAMFANIVEWVGSRGIFLALLISLGASVMTLFYSEVIGFAPCPLCWWQRVFLYPQVILFAMAAYKKEWYTGAAIDFSIVLSVFGFLVAVYHHLLQVVPGSGLPCPATGVSCSIRVMYEFGYITFPLLAVVLFAFLIVVMLCVRARKGV